MITYSIENDTANAKLDEDSLTLEIQAANITPAIDTFAVVGDQIQITFKAALSSAEQTTLDGVIAAHQGISAEPEPSKVSVTNEPKVITDKGHGSFDTKISHDWTDKNDWASPTDSEWIIEPSAGKKIEISKTEVQFTHDVKLATIAGGAKKFFFDIWVGNPAFNPGAAPTADNPAYVPGVTQGENPIRFLYKRTEFKSLKDVFNFGNEHFTMPVGVDGLPVGVTTVQFNYDQLIVLESSKYMQIRFSMEDHAEMGGSFCTASVVVRELPEEV